MNRRARPRRRCVPLPALSGREAALLYDALNDLLSALWDAYEEPILAVFERDAVVHDDSDPDWPSDIPDPFDPDDDNPF